MSKQQLQRTLATERRDQDFIMLHKILPHLKTAMEVINLLIVHLSKAFDSTILVKIFARLA